MKDDKQGAGPNHGGGSAGAGAPSFDQSSRLLSFVRRAVDDYEMIAPGDRIMVGLSGGKDSAALLAAMIELKRFYPIPFDVCACTVDMGFAGGDTSYMADFCRAYGVEFRCVSTNIAHVVFDVKKENISRCSSITSSAVRHWSSFRIYMSLALYAVSVSSPPSMAKRVASVMLATNRYCMFRRGSALSAAGSACRIMRWLSATAPGSPLCIIRYCRISSLYP
jgi:hypothetical protein